MVDTSDFLQADDVYKVISTIHAVASGHHTDDAIERYIGVDSEGRQGRYYRLAAEKLGFVTLVGHNNNTQLTAQGAAFARQPTAQQQVSMQSAIMSLPVFRAAAAYIQRDRPTLEQLRHWFIRYYPGAESTAERRFSTFVIYLRYCGYQF